MNEEELLNDFLNGYPETSHPLDRERFLNYALECIKNGHPIDFETFRNHGISDNRIEEYEIAFGWIKDTYEKIISENS